MNETSGPEHDLNDVAVPIHVSLDRAEARVAVLTEALVAVRRLYFEEDSFPAMEGEDSEYAHAVEDILGKINVIAATALERPSE